MPKPKIYLETTIPSYLAAWLSRDLVTAAHQQVTREWWENQRSYFALFVSEIVLQEASGGDPEAACRRLEALEGFPVLDLIDEVGQLAQKITGAGMISEKYFDDALHVAVATVHGMDYLLTWNLTHIANATLRRKYESVIRSEGYGPPIICTPEALTAEKMKTTKTKTKQPPSIVDELHAQREQHARQFNYDPEAIFEDWKRCQEKSDRDLVSFPPKRLDLEEDSV